MALKIVIADDHTMFVEALRNLFERTDNIDVMATTDNGDDLLNLIDDLQPDVALVDLSMPGPGARAIAKTVQERKDPTSLIALTMHLEPNLATMLIDYGFSSYVIKDAAFDELLDAIGYVVEGQTYLSKAIVEARNANTDNTDNTGGLTPRELECLKCAADGLSNRLIADRLEISERTVKYHFENILRKLNASRRGEAVAIGQRNNLI